MNKEQKKFLKKKDRQQKVKKKILEQRKAKRMETKAENEKFKEEREEEKKVNRQIGTINYERDGRPLTEEEIQKKLEENQSALNKMKKEYEETQNRVQEASPPKKGGCGGEADVVFCPNPD
jgi:hypothetical protein